MLKDHVIAQRVVDSVGVDNGDLAIWSLATEQGIDVLTVSARIS